MLIIFLGQYWATKIFKPGALWPQAGARARFFKIDPARIVGMCVCMFASEAINN